MITSSDLAAAKDACYYRLHPTTWVDRPNRSQLHRIKLIENSYGSRLLYNAVCDLYREWPFDRLGTLIQRVLLQRHVIWNNSFLATVEVRKPFLWWTRNAGWLEIELFEDHWSVMWTNNRDHHQRWRGPAFCINVSQITLNVAVTNKRTPAVMETALSFHWVEDIDRCNEIINFIRECLIHASNKRT
jgi:hypothetical protein